MKRFIVVVAGLVVSTAAYGVTTYSYIGPLFTSAVAPYTMSMRITGTFTTAVPLPPNMALTPIGPLGNGLALSWSFTDGVNTLTDVNSDEFGLSAQYAVATGSNGAITDWAIWLESHKSPWSVGETNLFVIEVESGGDNDNAEQGGTCNAVTAGHCSNASFGTERGSTDTVGVWTGGSLPVTAVPTLSAWGVLLLVALMVLGVLYSTQRRLR